MDLNGPRMEQSRRTEQTDLGVSPERIAACKWVPIAGTSEVWVLMPADNPRYRVQYDPENHRFTSRIEGVEQCEQ